VAETLQSSDLGVPEKPAGEPRLRFFATDSVEKFRRLGPRFLGHPVDTVEHVDLKE
jgi:glutamate racemase